MNLCRNERVLATLLCAFSLVAEGQNAPGRIGVRFELDGKPALAKRIEFYDDLGRLVSLSEVRDGFFEVPSIRPSDKVEVRVHLGGRTLVFPGIYGTKFEGDWIIGIDLPPFSDEIAWTIPKNIKPKEIWFINFNSHKGDGTAATVYVQ